jgi:hypothetical protein
MKSEAERRFEAFRALRTNDPDDDYGRALLRAIFDPLPPEPEPVKSLGQIASEARPGPDLSPWAKMYPGSQENWENIAAAVVKEHEARRPKPTVEFMAKAMFDGTREGHELPWEQISQTRQEFWIRMTRAVFPLFGVEP